ncbi:MAG: hypothetical protein AAGJ46_03345 [Planctomycetota bacterium]
MRTDKLAGQYCDIEGGSKMKKFSYNQKAAGWFPVGSISFGFRGRDQSSGANNRATAAAPRSGTATQQTGATPQDAAGQGGNREEPNTLNVTRSVDRASVELFDFAMRDRKATKADEDNARQVDIHFLHSVHVYKSDNINCEDQFIYPYLMIALDRVLFKGWEISASGDDRPTETLTLWFDKSAIRYDRTSNGRDWNHASPRGWDQHDNKEWLPGAEFKYFTQPN